MQQGEYIVIKVADIEEKIKEISNSVEQYDYHLLHACGSINAYNSILSNPKDLFSILEEVQTQLLKEISKTFLNPGNQDKADKETDKHVFQAIGETIINFPKITDNLQL